MQLLFKCPFYRNVMLFAMAWVSVTCDYVRVPGDWDPLWTVRGEAVTGEGVPPFGNLRAGYYWQNSTGWDSYVDIPLTAQEVSAQFVLKINQMPAEDCFIDVCLADQKSLETHGFDLEQLAQRDFRFTIGTIVFYEDGDGNGRFDEAPSNPTDDGSPEILYHIKEDYSFVLIDGNSDGVSLAGVPLGRGLNIIQRRGSHFEKKSLTEMLTFTLIEPCAHECDEVGQTSCNNGQVKTCEEDAYRCLVWGAPKHCQSGLGFCQDAHTCGECNNECYVPEKQCQEGIQRHCVEDQNGCYVWGAEEKCESGEGFCADDYECGYCADECGIPQSQCTEGELRSCVEDKNGCQVWSEYRRCSSGYGFCETKTDCGVCQHACDASQCSDGLIKRCEADTRGCRMLLEEARCQNFVCSELNSSECLEIEISHEQWGTEYRDEGYSIAHDGTADASYVVGATFGTIEKGPLKDNIHSGLQDMILTKLSGAGGEPEWNLQWGTISNDAAYRVGVDASGAIYVLGATEGAIAISYGLRDGILSKFQSDGTRLWDRQFGTARDDFPFNMALDQNGASFITGSTEGELVAERPDDGGPDDGGPDDGGPDDRGPDAFVVEIDSEGALGWQYQWGTSEKDQARGISLDSDGSIYICGVTAGVFEDAGTAPANTKLGMRDVFLSKFDAAGDFQWTRQWGSLQDDVGTSVAASKDGFVYVIGNTTGFIDETIQSPYHVAGNKEAFLTKLTAHGEILWTVQWGHRGTVNAFSAEVDSAGFIYVSGGTDELLAGGAPDIGKAAGGFDVYVVRYSPEGRLTWLSQFGTDKDDGGGDSITNAFNEDVTPKMFLDDYGRIHLAGTTLGSFAGDSSYQSSGVFRTVLTPGL